MKLETTFANRRISARDAQLAAIAAIAERAGATALHIIGSIGREEDDALSDIDAWLTFPDAAIGAVVRNRLDLYRQLGDILLVHETAGNRPIGGVYSLVIYQTDAGPMMVDWVLAPQRTSNVVPPMKTVYEYVPVPRVAHFSERHIDREAQQVYTLGERIDWFACMLFVTIKMIVRGKGEGFFPFLEESYRDACETFGFDDITVTNPSSLPNVSTMLRQLLPYAQDHQRYAIDAIDAFLQEMARE